MEDKLVGIGEFAALGCVSTRTLRHYQDKGLLQPAHVDENTGYRYYRVGQTRDLQTIRLLQTLGLSLDEVSDLITNHKANEVLSRVEECIADIERLQHDLNLARYLGNELLDAYRIALREIIFDKILIEHRPSRSILSFSVADITIPDQLSRAEQWTFLEAHLRHLLERDNLAPLCRNIGGVISRDQVASNDDPDYDRLFVYYDENLGSGLQTIDSIPAGFYLTVYRQHYRADEESHRAALALLKTLESEAKARGLRICGDYYCESIITAPLLGYEGYDGLSRLSVPVTEAS